MTGRKLQRGDLVLAKIPFTDLQASKLRPALVISEGLVGKDAVLIAISSVVRGQEADHDVVIDSQHLDFSRTKLLRTSVIRTHHLVTVEQPMISRRLGQLPEVWQQQVDQQLRMLLGLGHA